MWKHGRIIDLGTFGGTFSYASTINDRDQVVGFALNPVPDSFELGECGADGLAPTQKRAFVWQEGAGLRELGTLGGPDSCAMLINNRGQIAGNSFTSFTPNPGTGVPTQDPFFWKDGTMTDLGGLRRHPRPCERDEQPWPDLRRFGSRGGPDPAWILLGPGNDDGSHPDGRSPSRRP